MNIIIIYPADKTFVIDNISKGITDISILEDVFAWFNSGSGREHPEFVRSHSRSLCVNDFVSVNNQWYQCKGCGWEKVDREYINRIVENVEKSITFDGNAWSALHTCLIQIRRRYNMLDKEFDTTLTKKRMKQLDKLASKIAKEQIAMLDGMIIKQKARDSLKKIKA